MTLRRIDPEEAQALLEKGFVYLDVRTEQEFMLGHPAGAYNVPWQLEGGRDNTDFVSTVRRHFATGSKIILGCRSGNRSLAAARRLEDAGYSELVELRTGFSGKTDPFGRTIDKGWQAAGMPCAMDPLSGRDYRSLLADDRV